MIYQENITILNIHILNIDAPNFIKQALLDVKSQINHNTLIVDDVDKSFYQTDRSA